MKTCLGTVPLENGQQMEVYLLTTPADGYTEKLCHFLEHKGPVYFRDIQQRLLGNYASVCIDKYFIGEIEGEIAGQIYYGYPVDGTGIGNFGHVYTEPRHRKKGISKELMPFVMEDFYKSPARALLCSTGTPWVAKIYFEYGFQPVVPGADSGPLVLFNKGVAGDFDGFSQEYFTAGSSIRTKLGSMKECFDADKMLACDLGRRNIEWRRVGMASCVNDYRGAVFMQEDGQGIVTVATSEYGSLVGWGFFLNTGSVHESSSKVFDFIMHPNYESQTREFIGRSLAIAEEEGIGRSVAYCISLEDEKIGLLKDSGFKQVADIADYCNIDGSQCNLVILRSS